MVDSQCYQKEMFTITKDFWVEVKKIIGKLVLMELDLIVIL